jgi:hypothetical protein
MGNRVATSQYIGQCDRVRRKNASNEHKWHAMMGCAEPVSFQTFLASVDMTPMLDEDDTSSNWITEHRRSDPSTQAYRSWWGTERCWFIQTAGYEFIFLDATGEMLGSADDDDDDDPYTDDDDGAPTPAELAATLNRIIAVAHFLRNNANGWEEQGDRVEARRYRKHADKIDAAFAAHDATSLGKLVSVAGMTKVLGHKPDAEDVFGVVDRDTYLTANEIYRLSWGWAKR